MQVLTVHDAKWYDQAMTEPGAPALLPLEESGWLPLYTEAARWPEPHAEVVDLGCGTGRFGHALWLAEHYARYTGVDFSEGALVEARRYLSKLHGDRERQYVLADLREWEPDADRASNAVYVCLETLEHLEDDIDLVRRIPPGHRLIFSVPNYESESHVRTFRNVGDAWGRYEHLLSFRRWSRIDIDSSKVVHLYDTSRRADSW